MKVRVESADPRTVRTEALCVFALDEPLKVMGLGAGSKLAQMASSAGGKTGAKAGKISAVHAAGEIRAQRILVAGLGARRNIGADSIRMASGGLAKKAADMGLGKIAIVPPDSSVCEVGSAVSQTIEGAKLGTYRFEEFMGSKSASISDLTILASPTPRIKAAARRAEKTADAVMFTRGLGNMPPNVCTPQTLAGVAKKMCLTSKRLHCSVMGMTELKKKGFGGICAVGGGSDNEPKLITIQYNGGAKRKPVLLVGKAVTFDTGGISLKPGEKMDEMKFDKCGGCTVLGVIKAIDSLALPVNVVGLVPAVENMPGGRSYRPGDIIRLYSKKTAEILNTDAEGRLILADALAYGEKHYSPSEIIDLATLTGACIVALGANVAGMVANDDGISGKISKASEKTAERIWRLPLDDDYMDMIKSDVADMKNMGIGRAAGAITAAAFLKNAVGDTPWAHLDIAGVAWTQIATKDKPYNSKGATGFGVRLLVDYLSSHQ